MSPTPETPDPTTAWLDSARVAAVAAVVLLHIAAYGVTGLPVGSTDWWVANVADAAVRWCVPLLVMVSGALLLDPRRQDEPAGTFFRKRVRRVLVPLVAWSLIYTAWNQRELDLDALGRLSHLIDGIARGAPHYHLWFLYMIVLLYAFVPALRALVRTASRPVLVFTTGLGLVLAALAELHAATSTASPGPFTNNVLLYLPYFVAGHLIATAAPEHGPWKPAVLVVSSVAATAWGCHALWVEQGAAAGQYFYGYLSLTVIPMSLAVAMFFRSLPARPNRWRDTLGPLTLGAYLVHPLLLEGARAAWPGLLSGSQGVVIPAVTVGVLAASLVVTALLMRTRWLRAGV